MWTSGIIGIAGVVLGALLNHYLGNRSRERQWQAETRKAEYRELLTGINESFTTVLALSAKRPFFHDDDYEARLLLAETGAARSVADRIFIAEEVERLEVMRRWTTAARKFASGRDIVAFGNEVNQLSHEIRQAALKDVGRL